LQKNKKIILEILIMQDAMSLTRVIQLDQTRQRRGRLYESDRHRIEDALTACDGDVKETLKEFGLALDDELFDRFCRQAFNLTGDEWLSRSSRTANTAAAGNDGGDGMDGEGKSGDAAAEGEGKDGEGAEEGEEGKQQDNNSSSLTNSPLFQEVVELVTCAYAHPIQYGEDIRLAAARGEDARVEELLRRGCNPMATDGMGWTTLHHAAQWGRVSTIQTIKKGWPKIDVNARDRCGWTPFMNAVAGSHKNACLELKKMGANCSNSTNYGRNALHVASMKGLTEMVRLLLGMDKSMMKGKDKAGWTPLFCAVQHDELPSVRLLVAAGANIASADGIEKTADVYGDDVAQATMTGTQPASPRSARVDDEA